MALQELFYQALAESCWDLCIKCIKFQRDEKVAGNLLVILIGTLKERKCTEFKVWRDILKIIRPWYYSYQALRVYRELVQALRELKWGRPLLGRLKGIALERGSGLERAQFLSSLSSLYFAFGEKREGFTLVFLALREREKLYQEAEECELLACIGYSLMSSSYTKLGLNFFKKAERLSRKLPYLFYRYREPARVASYLISLGLKKEGTKVLLRTFLYLYHELFFKDYHEVREIIRYLRYIAEDLKEIKEIALAEKLEKLIGKVTIPIYYWGQGLCAYPE